MPGAWTETGLRKHCTGTVFYVDPNHQDTGDLKDGTDPTSPLATVQRGVDLCQDYRGDVVAVMANSNWQYNSPAATYPLPVQEDVIVATPGVRIVGVNPSGALGVCWTPATADGVCITVRSCDVLVEGFAFQGNAGGTGILADYANFYGDNLTVRHCFFDEIMDEGIILDFSWYADIHHNVFDEVDEYGIFTNPLTGDPAYTRIHHNWFYDAGTSAIGLPDADRSDIYENHVYNTDAASGNAGTPANCLIDLTGGSRNLVHRNTLSCVLPAAVAWDYVATCTSGAGDAWCQNYLMNGPSVTNP